MPISGATTQPPPGLRAQSPLLPVPPLESYAIRLFIIPGFVMSLSLRAALDLTMDVGNQRLYGQSAVGQRQHLCWRRRRLVQGRRPALLHRPVPSSSSRYTKSRRSPTEGAPSRSLRRVSHYSHYRVTLKTKQRNPRHPQRQLHDSQVPTHRSIREHNRTQYYLELR